MHQRKHDPNPRLGLATESVGVSNPRASHVPFHVPQTVPGLGGISRKLQSPRRQWEYDRTPPRDRPALPLRLPGRAPSELEHPEMPLYTSVTGQNCYASRAPISFASSYDRPAIGSFRRALDQERAGLMARYQETLDYVNGPLGRPACARPVDPGPDEVPRTSRPGTSVREIVQVSNAISQASISRACTPRAPTAASTNAGGGGGSSGVTTTSNAGPQQANPLLLATVGSEGGGEGSSGGAAAVGGGGSDSRAASHTQLLSGKSSRADNTNNASSFRESAGAAADGGASHEGVNPSGPHQPLRQQQQQHASMVPLSVSALDRSPPTGFDAAPAIAIPCGVPGLPTLFPQVPRSPNLNRHGATTARNSHLTSSVGGVGSSSGRSPNQQLQQRPQAQNVNQQSPRALQTQFLDGPIAWQRAATANSPGGGGGHSTIAGPPLPIAAPDGSVPHSRKTTPPPATPTANAQQQQQHHTTSTNNNSSPMNNSDPVMAARHQHLANIHTRHNKQQPSSRKGSHGYHGSVGGGVISISGSRKGSANAAMASIADGFKNAATVNVVNGTSPL